ncbi:DivIVA domain-containing protein [Modestobacter sp. NPDC049651]|uniref:DivIVA domain-containing protein n=1 Tax=unclassified Modestobacter TaxID=2643866 RepID=UPI0033E22134
MSAHEQPADDGRRLSPADVDAVTFTQATMLHPGYVTTEVDDFLSVVAGELGRLTTENQQLQDRVEELQQRVDSAPAPVSPSDQAVGILMTAQQTADRYVAEAEEVSRQMTSTARTQYEEQLAAAREKAGAIIQAAQEAATRVVGPAPGAGGGGEHPDAELLQEQVAYLKAFGSAVRTQLRSYLEALIADVEHEWGRADPAGVPPSPTRIPAQRPDVRRQPVPARFEGNAAGGS